MVTQINCVHINSVFNFITGIETIVYKIHVLLFEYL